MSLETIDVLLERLDVLRQKADEERHKRIVAEVQLEHERVRFERERAMRSELEVALASLVFDVRKRSVLERARDLLSRVRRETARPVLTMAHNDTIPRT